ncbi:hypothetical protein BU15DRAFT_64067 [Melanogaster broomeanus]|nr:hypothetical protein BU15DRAFT_64067 [Melanogaster broomeanus]
MTGKGISAMPTPTSNKAPSFSCNGKTSELLEFFEHFEDLAAGCSLGDVDKCKLVVRYVDKITKRFWISLAGYKSHDYMVLKDQILASYPGAKEGIKYTRRDLERVVVSLDNEDISSETGLFSYYREFRPIAVWLVTNEKISARERDQYFWQGLPLSVRRSIDRRLQLKLDYSRDDPTDYEEVYEAGRFVLSHDALVKSMREVHGAHASASPNAAKAMRTRAVIDSDEEDEHDMRKNDNPRDIHTKMVTSKPTILTAAQCDEAEELARKMHTLDITEDAYAAFYTRLACLAPAAAQAWAAPIFRQQSTSRSLTALRAPRNHLAAHTTLLCYMCGGPHLMRDCSVALEYIRAGRSIRENGYVTFPDHTRVYRHPTAGNFKESIDERYGGPLPPAAQPSLAT